MPIAQFLALADDIKSGDSRQKLENTRAILARGDNFTSIPYLYASNKGQVDGHEGRNRALALQELGYTTMPVELRMRDLRWSEQLDPEGEGLRCCSRKWLQNVACGRLRVPGRPAMSQFCVRS